MPERLLAPLKILAPTNDWLLLAVGGVLAHTQLMLTQFVPELSVLETGLEAASLTAAGSFAVTMFWWIIAITFTVLRVRERYDAWRDGREVSRLEQEKLRLEIAQLRREADQNGTDSSDLNG